MATPVPPCSDPAAAAARQRDLRTTGGFGECGQVADRCRSQLPAGTPGLERVLFEGARCATAENRFERARELFDQATRPEHAQSPAFPGMVFVFARFALFGQYPGEVDGILARAWPPDERVLVRAALEYLRDGTTTRARPEQVDARVDQWIAGPDDVLRQAALVARARFLSGLRYRTREGARLLAASLDRLVSPEEWLPTAYFSLYHQLAPDFILARPIYDAVSPYLHSASFLPVADNTFTYTELVSSTCADRVLQGRDRELLLGIQAAWSEGRLTPAVALGATVFVERREPGRADLLAFQGSLYEALGDDAEAQRHYWASHEACPYWDRSHEGLDVLWVRQRNRSFADAPASVERARLEVERTAFPPELETYVANWRSLTAESRDRLRYALRFWAPHVRPVQQSGQQMYLKPAYQLLSEVPGLSRYRDQRVGSSATFHDNRLLDDIGGVATQELAVVDLAGVLEAPFGDYNTAEHEFAHQFHFTLPRAQAACVDALYARAQSRSLFPDPYAAINAFEYFAQGVGYFTRPPGSPVRLGLNRQWLLDNDPDLDRFIASLPSASSTAAIPCPVAVSSP